MNNRIISRMKTQEKRKTQICKVFELKVDRSRLSKTTIEHLSLLFREAKWFYNHILSLPTINEADTTIKNVPVKVKDIFENRDLSVLTSHMKQGIKTRTFSAVKALNTTKKQGRKTGKLKYKSFVGSIYLKEYHGDFDLYFDNNTVRLSGLKQKLKVHGLDQIPKDAEIANAHIIKREKDYFFHITTFVYKTPNHYKEVPNNSTGIDFGCTTQLTLSSGVKIEFQVPVNKKIKRLDRKIDKKVNGKVGKNRGSNRRKRLQAKRRQEYVKLKNKKKDIRNKVVRAITRHYKYVCVQDENISAWKAGRHGKKIQNSGIGGIISDLKRKSRTSIVLSQFFPSTQLCPQCGARNHLKVSDRVYKCECGYVHDRDIKSAQCIHMEGMKYVVNGAFTAEQLPTDYRNVSISVDLKPEETLPSAFLDALDKVKGVKISVGTVESASREATGT